MPCTIWASGRKPARCLPKPNKCRKISRLKLIYSIHWPASGTAIGCWPAERTAWRLLLSSEGGPLVKIDRTVLAEVERRANSAHAIAIQNQWLLDIALDQLTLVRVGLLPAIFAQRCVQPTLDPLHVTAAVNGLRNAGDMTHLPRGLLTATWYHAVRGDVLGSKAALDEAQQIAERGPMPLYLADVHLTRARLAGCVALNAESLKDGAASWNVDPHAELALAAKLIRHHGYGRRYEELADAEEALGVAR